LSFDFKISWIVSASYAKVELPLASLSLLVLKRLLNIYCGSQHLWQAFVREKLMQTDSLVFEDLMSFALNLVFVEQEPSWLYFE